MSSAVRKPLYSNALNNCYHHPEYSAVCPLLGIRVTQRVTQNSAAFSLAPAYDRGARSTLQNNLRLQLGDEIADVRRVFLFARGFRRGRGDEFFEAWIIPERVPDGIDLENGDSETVWYLEQMIE